MRIKKLHIENFRGFQELDITFPDSKLAVFIGINGSGKSSILDCIATLLASFTTQLENKSRVNEFASKTAEYVFTDHDINFLSKWVVSAITIEDDKNQEFTWNVDYAMPDSIKKNQTGKVESLVDLFFNNLNLDHWCFALPVLAYYHCNRIIESQQLPQDVLLPHHSKFPQIYAYLEAFTKKIIGFQDFYEWFRLQEDLENEKKIKARNFNAVNRNLEAIRKAMTLFLQGFSTQDTISNLHVERNPRELILGFRASPESSLVIDKNGQPLRIEQLSAGEQMILMLVSDIARRLTIANPGLENPLEGTGIVLIDEIDLHLHPQWQREVIPCLQRAFPHIQFIVTTHSPQVLSHVRQEHILILDRGQVYSPSSDPYGRDTNAILEEVMETTKYPPEIEELSNQYFQLITFDKFDEAQQIRKKLEGILHPENPIFVKADALLTRKRLIGR